MGLDLSFELKPVLKHPDVKTSIDLADYSETFGGENGRDDHVHYWISVPGMLDENNERYYVGLDFYKQADGRILGSVRANKWGHTYAPFTTFLTQLGVTWEEV